VTRTRGRDEGSAGFVGAGGLQHGDAADVVAAKVQQHQVLGAFLGVGDELLFERGVLGGRRAPGPGAGNRAEW
jgi:hypothetical protein